MGDRKVISLKSPTTVENSIQSHLNRSAMNYTEEVKNLRATYDTGITKDVRFRKKQLKALLRLTVEQEEALCEGLSADLRKPCLESILTEIEMLRNEIREAISNIDAWNRAESPKKGLVNFFDTVHIKKDPYGVVLIMGSWNYPVLLLLKPFVGAIAAGNCVILKPSEISQNTTKVISDLLHQYINKETYRVVCGGVPETTELLKERFDYIFYTGSTPVGKIVRQAANKFLTPVTLELGGKCPTYIDAGVNIDVAAKRIMWGKIMNAGQTCIAPDYILCEKAVELVLIEACKKAITQFLGDNPKGSSDFCRIVSDSHYQRLMKLMESGKIVMGGICDPLARYIEPTIISNVKSGDPIMQEEIFGPILAIINVNDVDEAIGFIKSREKPLAIYIFSNNKKTVKKLVENTSSGSVCVNDVVMQYSCENTPFGGVGHSGMGAYGGKYTFETFSHKKTCLYKKLGAIGETLGSARYPPYTKNKIQFLNAVLKRRHFVSLMWMKEIVIFLLGIAVAAAFFHYSK